jgi:hypothetical protein
VDEHALLRAVTAVRQRHWPVVEVYTPYAVHGLDEALGWRRSRLSVACFLGGVAGAALALALQFWTTAWDWPLNVGGQPWNSLPAFVPVTFEAMVLCAGFSLVLAWLVRCRLYPGKVAPTSLPGATDNRFILAVAEPRLGEGVEDIRRFLQDNHAVVVEER